MMKLALIIILATIAPISYAVESVVTPNIEGICDSETINRIAKQAGMIAKDKWIHGPVDSDAADIGCAYRKYPKAGKRVKSIRH